jgi:hypothetical protein
LAIEPATGLIYVSSGRGVEIFDPDTQSFTHYSRDLNLRVGSLAFAPDGALWATTWPDRREVIRFTDRARGEVMLRFDADIDSIAFGQVGTDLDGLLFVSHNSGPPASTPTAQPSGSELTLVELATLRRVAVAQGGSRGDVVITTGDGRVLLSQSRQVDVLNSLLAPSIIATNPPAGANAPLPLGQVTIVFDQDMFQGDASDGASVLNPANYQLLGEAAGSIPPRAVAYDAGARTVSLLFDSLGPDRYALQVAATVSSLAGLALAAPFSTSFVTLLDFSPFVDFEFTNARSRRADQTISYDVRITNTSDRDLQLPVYLLLIPPDQFAGRPLDAIGPDDDGVWLVDLSANLPTDGRLGAGESTSATTVVISSPDAQRAAFDHSFLALPFPGLPPEFDSAPITGAVAGQPYEYQALASNPDGAEVSFLLYSAPDGMTLDAASGLVNWSPTADSPAEASVVLQVYDSRGGHATQEFTIQVDGGNRPPVINPLPEEILGREGTPLEIGVAAFDADVQPLIYWVQNIPPGAVFDTVRQTLRWTPTFDAAGTYLDVQFFVSDGVSQSQTSTTILIEPSNQAPHLVRPTDRTVGEGDPLRIQLSASDPEGAALTFSSNFLPGGAFLDPNTGLFEWTPAFFQHGVFEIPFTASDGTLSVTETTTFTVLNVNAPPVFANLGTWRMSEGETMRLRAFAFDPDNPGFVG